MIAAVKPAPVSPVPFDCQDTFVTLLPSIQRYAHQAFHRVRGERREELVQQVVANAYAALVRLSLRDRSDQAHASTLARYAIRQVRSGRCLGSCLNINDLSSYYAQRAKGIRMESLSTPDDQGLDWREALVEDRHAGPAETASARIDFSAWLDTLKRPKREIALSLSKGNRTQEVAHRFRLTPGRISQLRQEFHCSWHAFQQNAAS